MCFRSKRSSKKIGKRSKRAKGNEEGTGTEREDESAKEKEQSGGGGEGKRGRAERERGRCLGQDSACMAFSFSISTLGWLTKSFLDWSGPFLSKLYLCVASSSKLYKIFFDRFDHHACAAGME